MPDKNKTELTKKEAFLQEEYDFLQIILNTAQAIILILDSKGRIISFNPYIICSKIA